MLTCAPRDNVCVQASTMYHDDHNCLCTPLGIGRLSEVKKGFLPQKWYPVPLGVDGKPLTGMPYCTRCCFCTTFHSTFEFVPVHKTVLTSAENVTTVT